MTSALAMLTTMNGVTSAMLARQLWESEPFDDRVMPAMPAT